MVSAHEGVTFRGSLTRGRSVAAACWIGLFTAAAIVRFASLDVRTLWYDEVASWRTQSFSVAEMLRSCRMNVHPPGYFLLLKATVAVLGDSPWVMRGFSGICSLLAMLYAALLAYRFGPNLNGHRAWAAACALAASPVMILYAREVRMYALGTLVCLGGSYHALRGVTEENDRHLLAGSLWFAFGCYVHNYLLFHAYAFGLVATYEAAFRRRWRWLVLAALPAVIYLPWVGALLKQTSQVAQDYWILAPTWVSVGEMFWQLWCGDLGQQGLAEAIAGYAMTALLLAVALCSGPLGRFAALQFLCAFGIALALSIWWKPILFVRYLVPAFAVLLTAAFATWLVTPRWDVLGWLPVSWLVLFFAAWIWQLWPQWTLDGQKGLQGAVQHVRSRRSEGELVVSDNVFIVLPWMYYDRDGQVYLYRPSGYERMRHYLGKALFRPEEVLSMEQMKQKMTEASGIWEAGPSMVTMLLGDDFVLVTDETRSFLGDSFPPAPFMREFVVQHWRRGEQSEGPTGSGSEQHRGQRGGTDQGAVDGERQQGSGGDQAQQPAQRPEPGQERSQEADGQR